MVIQQRLNDAAIALQQVFGPANVKFAVFGGYAVTTLGGTRESKDVDCIAKLTKEDAIRLLDQRNGFAVVPQTRQDYVAFLWSKSGDSRNAVLVEIFPERFPGAKFSMDRLQTSQVTLQGFHLGTGVSTFADPVALFKGKLCAAATRNKFHDSADLRMLLTRFEGRIKPKIGELNLKYVGLAIKRYTILETIFKNLGVDVKRAKQLAGSPDAEQAYPRGAGQIQSALLK